VDAEGNTGYFSSVAVHSDGHPIVSFQDADGGGGARAAVGSQILGVGAGAKGQAFRMGGPYPNPARAGRPLAMSIELPVAAVVRLEVFDAAGRRIGARPPEALGAGRSPLSWNPGFHSPGIFLLRATTSAGEHVSKRVVVVR
jgi:hypothetical protein